MSSSLNFLKLLKAVTAIYVLTTVIIPTTQADRFARSESRIVDGVNVTPPNKYPMIVNFQQYGEYRCTGTILNKYYVLTAGNCIQYATYGSNAYVVAGIYYIGDPDVRYLQNISVSNVTYHERFNDQKKGFTANDIAVVKLSTPFIWNDYVTPTNLPLPEWTLLPNEELKVISVGWGYGRNNSYPYDPVRPLQEAELLLLTTEDCQRLDYYFPFTDDQTCTKVINGVGPCVDDYGGPLFSYNKDGNKHIQIGITSYIFEYCGESDSPRPPGYTKLSKYVSWIEEAVRECPPPDASDECT